MLIGVFGLLAPGLGHALTLNPQASPELAGELRSVLCCSTSPWSTQSPVLTEGVRLANGLVLSFGLTSVAELSRSVGVISKVDGTASWSMIDHGDGAGAPLSQPLAAAVTSAADDGGVTGTYAASELNESATLVVPVAVGSPAYASARPWHGEGPGSRSRVWSEITRGYLVTLESSELVSLAVRSASVETLVTTAAVGGVGAAPEPASLALSLSALALAGAAARRGRR